MRSQQDIGQNCKVQMHKWKSFFCTSAAAIIFLAAVILRFLHLTQQGIFYYDEAWYQLVATTYLKLPHWYHLIQSGLSGEQAFHQVYDWGFFPQISYKPTYIVLLMMTKLIVGITNPTAGAYLSAILGLGIIGMIYVLLKDLTGHRWLALTGAALASVSGIEVSYSRLSFPHQLAGLALLIYCYVYLRRLKQTNISLKAQYGLGVLTGLLLTTHDQMLPIILILSLFEISILIYQYRFKLTTLVHASTFIGGLTTPIVFWQLVTVLLREFFQHTLGKRYVAFYFKEVFQHVTAHKVTVAHVVQQSDYAYFFKVLSQTEGVLFLILFFLGNIALLYQMLRYKDCRALFLSMLIISTFILISLYPNKVLRLSVPFFPLFLLTAAFGINTIYGFFSKRNAVLGISVSSICVLLAMLQPLAYSLKFSTLTSGYSAVVADLKKLVKKKAKIATPYNFPIYTLYLQDKVYSFKDKTQLADLVQNQNVHYIIFDFEQLYKLCDSFPEFCKAESSFLIPLREEEAMSSERIKVYSNLYRAYLIPMLDNNYPYDLTAYLVHDPGRYRLNQIRLYHIKPK